MKNKLMFGMVMVLFLFVLAPHWLCADTTSELAGSRQTEEARGPQTPEKLLQVIKALFAYPDVDGHDFCEKQLSIDRAIWSKYPSGAIDSEYVPSASMFPPAPFH